MENIAVVAGSLHTVPLELRPLADSPVAAPATPAVNLTAVPAAPADSSSASPTYKKWWVWTGIGAVVVGGAVTAFLLTRRSNDSCGGIGYACLEIK